MKQELLKSIVHIRHSSSDFRKLEDSNISASVTNIAFDGIELITDVPEGSYTERLAIQKGIPYAYTMEE